MAKKKSQEDRMREHMAELGHRGGLIGGRSMSEAKRRAVRENGKLGGRPRKKGGHYAS